MTTTPTEYLPIEEMTFFSKLEDACDYVYELVSRWTPLAQDTVGKQMIRSIDSIGANLVEGDGRSTQPDSVRFFIIARASGRESKFWLRRAAKRHLITDVQKGQIEEALDHAMKAINKLIAYRRSVSKNVVREVTRTGYKDVLEEIEHDA